MQYALIHISMVPHECGLEVIMVAMAVDSFQGGHFEQEARQGIKKVVIEHEGFETGTEDEGVGDRLVLKLVIGESQILQVGHAAYVRGNAV